VPLDQAPANAERPAADPAGLPTELPAPNGNGASPDEIEAATGPQS
jgi:hypothetical protein